MVIQRWSCYNKAQNCPVPRHSLDGTFGLRRNDTHHKVPFGSENLQRPKMQHKTQHHQIQRTNTLV